MNFSLTTHNHAVVKQYRRRVAPTKPREAPLATLDKVSIDIAVVLGNTSMPIHQVLRLGRGAIIELASSEGDEVRILANNKPVARGTVIVRGNRIAVESRNSSSTRPARPDPIAFGFCFATKRYMSMAALVRARGNCYIGAVRAPFPARIHPTCGRGGIGRRTSLRC
jgi:flagellar motor switch protein FliN